MNDILNCGSFLLLGDAGPIMCGTEIDLEVRMSNEPSVPSATKVRQ